MIIAIDTSTSVCRIVFIDGQNSQVNEWDAGRELADGLIGYLRTLLQEQHKTWADIKGIAVFKGPGSFTGLRIGLTVANTIADAQAVAIVGETGEDWLEKATHRLEDGQNDKLVMPHYGREANITKPRK